MENTKISSTADLPNKWRLFGEAYQTDNSFPKAVIRDNFKQHIVAITNEGMLGQDNVITFIILETKKNEYSRLLKLLLSRFGGNGKSKFNIRDCSDQKIIDDIYNDHNKRNSAKNNINIDKDNQGRINAVYDVIDDAMNMRASDIHIENHGNLCTVKFRVNTELVVYKTDIKSFGLSFAQICYSTLTSMGEEEGTGAGTYNENELLEGDFTIKTKNHTVKARMVNLSLNYDSNFDFILRLIDKNKNVEAKPLTELSFSVHVANSLGAATRMNTGLILVCGITGSGKSTSMQNILLNESHESAGHRKQITLESPVEYPLPNITQVSAVDDDGTKGATNNFSFGNLNRYLLRSDPDTLGYGELRDEESAKAAYKGVESGHKVLATTHTNSALSCFPRLHSFGLTYEQISKEGFISGILYQHLIPRLCPHCSIPYKSGSIAPQYDEFFVLNNFMLREKSVDLNTLMKITHELPEGKSLIRHLQNSGVINSRQAINMLSSLNGMNDEVVNRKFTERLMTLVDDNKKRSDDLNIRFRGKGCSDPKCFNGTTGVMPCAEVIVPDPEFLSLVAQEKLIEAKNYWRTNLNGKTAMEDSYDKIFSGQADPRIVERYLSKQLNEH
jgi:type II secretory ATPase GspE/PulE/Tfp pilus assembly ATPase PilB-like protein